MAALRKTETSSKRADSRSPDRNLARFYCNPWPNILDAPAKNKHPTATWATNFAPVKVILHNYSIESVILPLNLFRFAVFPTHASSNTGQQHYRSDQCKKLSQRLVCMQLFRACILLLNDISNRTRWHVRINYINVIFRHGIKIREPN